MTSSHSQTRGCSHGSARLRLLILNSPGISGPRLPLSRRCSVVTVKWLRPASVTGPGIEQRLTAPGGPFFLFRELGERNAQVLRESAKRLLPLEDIDIRATAWGTTIGFFVSNALTEVLTS